MKNFVEELRWRGMIQDIMPETEEHLPQGHTAYVRSSGSVLVSLSQPNARYAMNPQ